ncbi:MAG: flagellar hook-length control protein FliK [bacterium]|nr:flagellar hook-length control protein FliK [bacterium]
MILSRLFTQGPQAEESGRINQTQSVKTADVNSQIRSLVPGQTIRGEVVSRNGAEVQIRVSEDMVLNARVDQNIHLEQGKNVTFEVRNNGRTLSLSPLFTNVSADVNVLKALDMAGLPVNETSVEMTRQLMEAGLPVNKGSLQQVYREINSFPEGEISDVIDLHRLQMPVNQTNMQQMISYRNLTHQLIGGLTDILDELPQTTQDMLAGGNIREAAELYRELFRIAGEEPADPLAQGELASEGAQAEGLQTEGLQTEEIPADTQGTAAGKAVLPGEALLETFGGSGQESRVPENGNGSVPLSGQARDLLVRELLQAVEELRLAPQESGSFAEQIRQFGQGGLSNTAFFGMAENLLEAAARTDGGMEILQKLFSGREFSGVLSDALKNQWTLRPEEVSRQGKVEELYQRLDRQLKSLTGTLEAAGQTENPVYRAVANVSQNVDFMNQINQMFTYVQLPLHLQHSDAHGELYVYTNKRSLAANDGSVSALLHLDMANLGPVDVYVALQETKVNTKFYVADDEILDFIGKHMNILTDRLQMRGYDCSCSMTLRDAGKEESGGLAPLLNQESGVLLSQYAFDVRT